MRFLFFLLIISITSFGQSTIKGKITDSRGEVLPLTNIVSLKSKNGTITNERGEFELHNLSNDDTLKITNIAFIPKLVAIHSFRSGDEIVLNDSIKQLVEVVVRNFNSFKKVLNLGYLSSSNRGEFKLIPGNQLAIFISNPNNREGWIKNVSFKIKDFGKCKNSLRIRLLNRNSITTNPTFDILHENIILLSNNLKKKNTVDISEYKVILPKDGIFVIIEWLFPDNKCDKNSYPSIAANLETETNEVWLNFRDKKWGHSNRPRLPNGNFMTPNIGIEVAF